MKKAFSLLILIIISGQITSQTEPDKLKIRKADTISGPNNGSMKVTVIKKETKEPIVDTLTVFVTTMATYTVLPNNEGETMVKFLKPGSYDIRVSVKGYMTQEIRQIIIGEGKTAYITIGLTSIVDKQKKRKRRNK